MIELTAAQGAFRAHDPAFAEVLGDAARLVRVVQTDAHEGPVYVAAEDALYFTTVPREGSPSSAWRSTASGWSGVPGTSPWYGPMPTPPTA